MIPEIQLEELKEKADIVNIISSYIPLKKRGKNHLGLCPFHSEKTASFTVSQEKGLFHCFGCGKGGNVFSFVMEMEKVDFAEACEIIGEKSGIHVENVKSSSPQRTITEKYYAILEAACKFYESKLDPNNEYIKKRGILNPRSFRLGLADGSWDSLYNYLISKGVSQEDLEKVGLILPRQSGSGFYDRFRNRLMFPICDHRNRVIGFSGRALADEEPKYLNSPDSVIFNKGDNLYNLGLAKDAIKDQKAVLLVEGNIDVVSTYEAGIKNVVAPLGTAFTPSQAKLIKRFTDLVVIAFDNDASGLAASERTQEILRDNGVRVRIASIKDAKDPDELVKKHGKEALIAAIQGSSPATEFRIRRIIGRFNLAETEGRVRAAHEVTAMLSQENDKILRGEYAKLASQLLNIPLERLTEELTAKETFFGKKSNLKRVTGKPSSRTKEAEKNLIRLILEWEEALVRIKDELPLESFTNYKNIMQKLWETKPADALGSLREDDAKVLREIMLCEEPLDDKETILTDCIKSLKAESIKTQINEIRESMANARQEGESELIKRMNQEYLNLNEILRSLVR